MKNYVGIDISQKEFHRYNSQRQPALKVYANTETGVADFITRLGANDHCVLEATGTYSLLLSYRLAEAGREFSVINPRESKLFRSMLNATWKDDQSDARLLSLFGQRMQPPLFRPASKECCQLKQKRALLRLLKKQKAAQQNFLHSLQANPFKDQQTEDGIQAVIDSFERRIAEVQQQVGALSRETFAGIYPLVHSVKGIGPVAAAALIEATQGFTAFQTGKQFAKYIGICPTFAQSGTSVRLPSRINRSGDPQLRATLYICTWSAIRYNRPCKALYERLLARGKPTKVALVAVMNKLIRQVFAVVQKRQVFDNFYETPEPQKTT